MTPARLRVTGDGPLARRLAPLVEAAQDCLARNIVPGRGPGEPGRYLRAGGGYPDPWTRDAAINAWQAGSWLVPDVAGATLAMVCGPDGTVADDDQWWDQVCWVLGAREQALVTGEPEWAERGLRVGAATLSRLEARHLDPGTGLFQGPAVMADGITGYPVELHDPERAAESFVLDHRATRTVCALSTNALYVLAFDALADLAAAAGGPEAPWRRRAERHRVLVRERFTLPGGRLAYLLTDAGPNEAQEGLGLALAILAGVVPRADAQERARSADRTAFGLPAVWPDNPGLPPGRFGRHGSALWPMIMGVWAQAVAASGDARTFGAELDRLCTLIERSGGAFFELYSPITGDPDGGWQAGRDWRSEPDQTWSATAFLGTVLHGLAGLTASPSGLVARPCLPAGADRIGLSGLPWRGGTLEVVLHGEGDRVGRVLLDGVPLPPADDGRFAVPATASGRPARLEVFCNEQE